MAGPKRPRWRARRYPTQIERQLGYYPKWLRRKLRRLYLPPKWFQSYSRQLGLISRIQKRGKVKLGEKELIIETTMTDFMEKLAKGFGPALVFVVKPKDIERYPQLKASYFDWMPEQRGAIGGFGIHFAKCEGERNYTALIHYVGQRTLFYKLSRGRQDSLRGWEKAALRFAERVLSRAGVKRIAILPENDPVLRGVPTIARRTFYGALAEWGDYKPAALRVVLPGYMGQEPDRVIKTKYLVKNV